MGSATATPTASAAEPPQTLCDNLCWLLDRANHALSTEMSAALEGIGLSPRKHMVLAAALTGEHTQTELAKLVGLDKTTMVVTVDELEAAGLAERRPSPSDRRVRVIGVTKAGARKVREAKTVTDAVRSDVLDSLPAGERRAFLSALTRLVGDRLSAPVPCAQPPRRRAPRG